MKLILMPSSTSISLLSSVPFDWVVDGSKIGAGDVEGWMTSNWTLLMSSMNDVCWWDKEDSAFRLSETRRAALNWMVTSSCRSWLEFLNDLIRIDCWLANDVSGSAIEQEVDFNDWGCCCWRRPRLMEELMTDRRGLDMTSADCFSPNTTSFRGNWIDSDGLKVGETLGQLRNWWRCLFLFNWRWLSWWRWRPRNRVENFSQADRNCKAKMIS